MKTSHLSLIALLFFSNCTTEKKNEIPNGIATFQSEIKQLKDYFHIPGLAVMVQQGDSTLYEDYLGLADVERNIRVDSTTQFPIASITKVFAGVALFKLVEEEKLSLEAPIDMYLANPVFGDSIKVKHVLSHTSQGDVGQHFYYSYRFGALTSVIKKASGTSFENYLQQRIFSMLDLKNTFFLSDSSMVTSTMARPYNFDEQRLAGQVEYGVSASAGIVSTVRDMVKFSKGLDDNSLLTSASKKQMFEPFQPHLPYGLGIFSQEVENKKILWAYGQYDSYSSLLLKVPEDDLTLVVLANNNLMSDPARLIYGDGLSSLFSLSFLKNFVLDSSEMPLFEKPTSAAVARHSNFHRKKLLAEALAASFMARFDNTELEKSKQLLRTVFEQFLNYGNYADLNLLHNLTFLKSVHFYKELGSFEEFDLQIEAISKKLLKRDPNNPYANVYMGDYWDRKGDLEKARYHYEAIANAKNFSPFWYTQPAKSWLETHK